MTRSLRVAAAAFCVALSAGCGASIAPVPTARANGFAHVLSVPLGPTSIVAGGGAITTLCPATSDPFEAPCLGNVRMMSTTTGAFPDSVNGLTPTDLASVYAYPAPHQQSATAQIVGIVVAYDNANAESDLATYRSYFGLSSCTSGNGCFLKVGAAAPTPSPSTAARHRSMSRFSISAHPASTSSGWAAEADADIEVVSAVCGNCRIVLSEAASDSIYDLANAVSAAVGAGATVINASFGATESSSLTSLESSFEPAHVKVVAAAGDAGHELLFPADLTNVVAVSGTTLNVSGTTVTQSLWQNSGGGCSSVFAAASYQPAWCGSRSIADVAAVADPNTGVAFYDAGKGGWGIVGGTSIAAPVITGMFALSGDTSAGSGAQRLYANSGKFLQVQNAGILDGLGTPNGLAAF